MSHGRCRLRGRSGNSARDVPRAPRWTSSLCSLHMEIPSRAGCLGKLVAVLPGFSVELSSVVAYLRSGQASREPLDLEPGKLLKSAGTQSLPGAT